jgi:MoaA/NifB/PqqE/SkfB family radical SAM enzyme
VEKPPVTLAMLTDRTCNLTCPSCRREHQTDKPAMSVQAMVDRLPGLRVITLLLSGDPFASRHAMDFLTSGDHALPHVIIWTNGLLLPKSWPRIKRKVTVVVMSIDAATQATYEQVRRGGRWGELLTALAFCRDLKDSGEIVEWQINFVCQAANYREMPAFVELGLEYHCTRVQFAAIASWPHLTPAEWERMNIANPTHPEFPQLCQTLADSRLRLPIADTSALSPEALASVARKRAGDDCFAFRQ